MCHSPEHQCTGSHASCKPSDCRTICSDPWLQIVIAWHVVSLPTVEQPVLTYGGSCRPAQRSRPPSTFKTADSFIWILILTINMLLASFTLHKVQKYLSGFGLTRKEDVTWLSLEA